MLLCFAKIGYEIYILKKANNKNLQLKKIFYLLI